MAKDNTIKIKVSDGDTLKDLERKLKKAAGGFDALSTSQRGADRAGKGLSKQSSNQTKNFSKIQQGISGGLVPAYATLAAQVFAVSAAFQFLSQSANFRNLIKGQEAFGAVTGNAYKTITKAVQDATMGQIAYQDAAQAVAIGMAGGLSPSQLERLGEAAKNTSLALGRDLTDSFNRLIRGTTKAEPELLDELGIILRLEPALKNYATQINKTPQQLNQFEKSQAIVNEVLSQAESKFGRITEVMDPAAFAMGQFGKAFDDLLNMLKQGVGFLAEKILPFFTDNVYALSAALALFAVPIVKSILPNMDEWEKSSKAKLKSIRSEIAETTDQQKMYAQAQAAASGDPKALQAATKSGQKGAQGILKSAGYKQKGDLTQRQVAAYKRSMQQKRGIWKKLNAEERRDFQRHLNQLDISHKASIGKQQLATKMSEQYKVSLYQKTAMRYRQLQMGMVTATRVAAKAMNAALMATGWIGLIAMVGAIVMEIYRAFVPVNEELEKHKEKLKDATEAAKTLNSELAKMNQLQNEGTVEGIMAVRQGLNAMKSTDTGSRVTEFNLAASSDMSYDISKRRNKTIKKPTKEFTKYMQEEAKVFRNLSTLIQGDAGLANAYLDLADAIEKGQKLTDDEMNFIAEKEKGYKSLAATLETAAEAEKAYRQSVRQAIGKSLYGADLKLGATNMVKVTDARIKEEQLAMAEAENKRRKEQSDNTIKGFFGSDYTPVTDEERANMSNDRIKNLNIERKGYTDTLALIKEINDEELNQLKTQQDIRLLQAEQKAAKGIDAQIAAKQTADETKNLAILNQKKAITNAERAAAIAQIEYESETDVEKKKIKEQLRDIANEEVLTQEALLDFVKDEEDHQRMILEIKREQMLIENDQLRLRSELIDKQIEAAGYNTFFSGTRFGKMAAEELAIEQAKFDIATKTLDVQKQREDHERKLVDQKDYEGSIEATNAALKIANAEKLLDLDRERLAVQEYLATDLGKLHQSFAKGIEDMFTKVIQGTADAKDAFLGLAKLMLQKIAEIAAANLAASALSGMGLGMPIPMAKGGIIPKYSMGGIATEPTYLVGEGRHNEAVVPLPDGRSIPVTMSGGAGDVNNVSINVNVDGSTTNSFDGERGKALGRMIEAATMEIIQREKRPGGVLGR